jgi:hypothetical protein
MGRLRIITEEETRKFPPESTAKQPNIRTLNAHWSIEVVPSLFMPLLYHIWSSAAPTVDERSKRFTFETKDERKRKKKGENREKCVDGYDE